MPDEAREKIAETLRKINVEPVDIPQAVVVENDKGEKVVLISDMYLPADFIRKMLAKADPVLVSLPLFVSSEYGVQKVSTELFFEVYKS